MPVFKFRSLDEAREALLVQPGGPDHLRRVAWLWAFSERLFRPRFPPGVHRYRSLEESQRAREGWEAGSVPGA